MNFVWSNQSHLAPSMPMSFVAVAAGLQLISFHLDEMQVFVGLVYDTQPPVLMYNFKCSHLHFSHV